MTAPVNVLYLGMATDIMAPLLLVPDLDNLYVLNSTDPAYGSWEEHTHHIRTVLTQGNDKGFSNPYDLEENPDSRNWKNVHALEGPSRIVHDEDIPDSKCLTGSPISDQHCYTHSVWKLQFMYNGKIRNLIYYYNFYFTSYAWPTDIQNIHYYIWNGAYRWDLLKEGEIVREMTEERAAPNAYVYALSFNHTEFPEHIWVYNGHERYGQSVAKMKLDFSAANWYEKKYSDNSNNNSNNNYNRGSQNGGKTRRQRRKQKKLSRRKRTSVKTRRIRRRRN